jgi:hypothetical protein
MKAQIKQLKDEKVTAESELQRETAAKAKIQLEKAKEKGEMQERIDQLSAESYSGRRPSMLEKREILSRTESLDARNEAVEKARQDDKQQQLQGLTAKLSARGPASARSRRVAESSPSRSQAGVAEAKVEHSKMSGSPSQLSLSMIAENDQALMQSISVPCSGLPNPDNEGDDDEFPDLSDSASDDIYDVSDNSSEEEGDELSVADVFSFVAKMVSSRRTHAGKSTRTHLVGSTMKKCVFYCVWPTAMAPLLTLGSAALLRGG